MASCCEKVVCVIDDDPNIRDSLSDLLSDEGYTVVTAINGQDGLAKLRHPEPRPCVILLDLMMPVMNGLQFCEEKRRDPSLANIPVVVISADTNGRQKAQLIGGDYLPKPMRIETLLDTVERHCA